ncbi:DNA-binding transcriptional activator of the SARP family [Sanguibacter gelidistatuariae]|uniref:DNA-binding transcriptional activator of the SARP family n=1 Tax=Sanguibacter gelidistatuariae TaxID=1814289 RepID=A0A1G6T1H9_9MICO|nr:LysM peptidoglycan-binding domain-containing protein [Sanguibacter gelidistatuariae]SDD22813.1 DNA-binding transcriptional activator of the SARP family [Sanguibacter gelidistatuariae]
MNQHTDRQTTRARDRLRAGLALLVLLALVVGLPFALLVVAPMPVPTAMPDWDGIWQSLIQPDDGSLFVGLLAVVAWLAWAAFTISVLTELTSTLRRVPAPSIPLLGWSQRAAAGLVAASAMLLVSGGPVAMAPAAYATVGYVPLPIDAQAAPAAAGTPGGVSGTGSEAGPTTPDLAAFGGQGDHPLVTVAHGDTLWSLAEHHLGSGTRYAEIRDLNLGAPQADGRALSSDHWIYPGWTLQLPTDASNLPTRVEETADAGLAEPVAHVVEPGESLWAIAGDELDDELRYVEIFDANAGLVQADGRALTDPDLIQPGWLLTIPTSPTSIAPPAPPVMVEPLPPVPEVAPDLPSVPPMPQATGTPTAEATPPAETTPTTGTTPGAGATEDTDTSEVAPDDTTEAEPTSSFATSLFLGLTALAAAGVIGEMTRRRLLRQRVRRTGERIPMPVPGSLEQVAETALRRAPQPLTLTELKDSLLALAARCRAAARQLPRVQLIRLTETDIELVLADSDDDPIGPFQTIDGQTWTALTSDLLAAEAIATDDVAEPYPALVTIGIEGEAVLILNLEAAGTLSITGPGDAPVEVARAIATELLTSELTGRIGLVAGKEVADLAAVSDRVRLQIVDDEDDRAGQLNLRNADVARVLKAEGIHDTLVARSTGTVPDVWLPVIFMVTRPETDGVAIGSQESPVAAAPWSGSVLITATPQEHGFEVRIGPEGRAQLEPLGLPFRPQRLTVENYCELVNLLRLGSDPTAEDADGTGDETRDLEEEFTSALAAASPETPILASHVGVFESRDPAAPRVKVLGRVEIDGAPSGGHKRARELIVYLALHGPATGPELDEILWSGERINARTRASLVYRARQWFGRDYLPVVGEDGLYRLGDDVTCDWTDFQEHARRGLTAGTDGSADLAAALRLVRDRPFLGIGGTEFIWAETEIQAMIGLIADTAHLLAEVQLRKGQNRAAVETAMIGIRAEPCSETLHRDAIQALTAEGDVGRATELADALYERVHHLDPECTRQEVDEVLRIERVR